MTYNGRELNAVVVNDVYVLEGEYIERSTTAVRGRGLSQSNNFVASSRLAQQQ